MIHIPKECHVPINSLLWQHLLRIFLHTNVDCLVIIGTSPKVTPDCLHSTKLKTYDGIQHRLCDNKMLYDDVYRQLQLQVNVMAYFTMISVQSDECL